MLPVRHLKSCIILIWSCRWEEILSLIEFFRVWSPILINGPFNMTCRSHYILILDWLGVERWGSIPVSLVKILNHLSLMFWSVCILIFMHVNFALLDWIGDACCNWSSVTRMGLVEKGVRNSCFKGLVIHLDFIFYQIN